MSTAHAGHSHPHAGSHGHAHQHAHHGHGHAGGHGGRSADRRRLGLTLILAALYMVAEAVGGLLTGSLALLADAGHMLSDAAALGLSLFAIWISQRPSNPRRTWGYHRTEILAALANGAALVGISIWIFAEAVSRLFHPTPVQGSVMMGIAAGGLMVNLIGLGILSGGLSGGPSGGSTGNLNLRGAWLHVLTDALGSVQAIAAGALIWAFGWNWADPVASLLISLLVIYSAWSLIRETLGVLMEGTPAHIDLAEVREALSCVPGVCGVHDLHVWTITSGMEALSAHLVSDDSTPYGTVLSRVQDTLHDRFGIDHATVQIEPEHCERHAGHP
jgi:cobalt-zinc-cadmium efflux system protein